MINGRETVVGYLEINIFRCHFIHNKSQVIGSRIQFRPSWWKPASIIRAMVEAGSSPETSVNFYQTTRRNNSEDSHLFCKDFVM
jgi:hypothetical protein